MKRLNKLLLMLLVLAVLVAAILLMTLLQTEEPEETVDNRLYDFGVQDVTAVSWIYAGNELSFAREGDGWVCVTDPSLTVLDVPMRSKLLTLVSVTVSRIIEQPDVLSSYSLDNPQCSIFFTANGSEYSLAIGGSAVSGGNYLLTGDGIVYVSNGTSLLDGFSCALSDLTETE